MQKISYHYTVIQMKVVFHITCMYSENKEEQLLHRLILSSGNATFCFMKSVM